MKKPFVYNIFQKTIITPPWTTTAIRTHCRIDNTTNHPPKPSNVDSTSWMPLQLIARVSEFFCKASYFLLTSKC